MSGQSWADKAGLRHVPHTFLCHCCTLITAEQRGSPSAEAGYPVGEMVKDKKMYQPDQGLGMKTFNTLENIWEKSSEHVERLSLYRGAFWSLLCCAKPQNKFTLTV